MCKEGVSLPKRWQGHLVGSQARHSAWRAEMPPFCVEEFADFCSLRIITSTYTIINASHAFEWQEWQRSIILRDHSAVSLLTHAFMRCLPSCCFISLLLQILNCCFNTFPWREIVSFDLLQSGRCEQRKIWVRTVNIPWQTQRPKPSPHVAHTPTPVQAGSLRCC